MRTIRVIYQSGLLSPLGPVDLPENTPLTLALLDGDDVPAEGITGAASTNAAFAFLSDSQEDIYTSADGEAV